jgi:hypothetical protein
MPHPQLSRPKSVFAKNHSLTENIDNLREVFKAAPKVADWPYSSFHRYVERGIYDLDWETDDYVRSLEME